MKKSSFSKKLLSAFLAVVMALSCCTAAFTAFAENYSDTESRLYEASNSYNYLGWVQTSDEQKLSALLDLVDEFLATANLNSLLADFAPGGVLNVNELLKNAASGTDLTFALDLPNIQVDLSSVDGVLATIASAANSIHNGKWPSSILADVGCIGDINLGGIYKDFYKDGKRSGKQAMTRENSSAKEIISGILNILYTNTHDISSAIQDQDSPLWHKSGLTLQKALNDNLTINIFGNIVDPMNLLQMLTVDNGALPANWYADPVNNLLVYFLKDLLIDPLIVSEEQNFPNYVNLGDYGRWGFKDSKDSNVMYSFEQVAVMILNKIVFSDIKNINSEYVFAGSDKLEYSVNDALMDQALNIFEPVMKKVLMPLFSTISVDFGFIPELTRLYANYQIEEMDFNPATAAAAKAGWSANQVNSWISDDYSTIAEFLTKFNDWDGNPLFPDITAKSSAAVVKAALIEYFTNTLERDTEEVDLTYLFTNMLYSPIAEALGCPTGMLNLNVRDYYFGNYAKFFNDKASTLFPANGKRDEAGALNSMYPVLREVLSALFPTFSEWETAAIPDASNGIPAAIQGITNNVVKSAGVLLTRVADSTNKAILKDFRNDPKHPENKTAVLTESNIEEALTPLMIGAVMHAETFSQVHAETWDMVKDLNGVFFLLLSEYLKTVLPEFDYMPIAYDKATNTIKADLEKVLLPMARDCIAVIAQGIVPIGWDVYKNGGLKKNAQGEYIAEFKDNTDIFDLVNGVVCFFADDLGVAPLFGLTEFVTRKNGTGSTTRSAINRGNDLWKNADIMINNLMPTFSTLLTNDKAGTFNSKEFFYDTLLKGLLTIGNPNGTQYGHGQGISTMVYEFIYLLFGSQPLTSKPVINVVYDFLKEALNTVFAPRYDGDNNNNSKITNALIPDYTVTTNPAPFTDLIQSQTLFGVSQGKAGPSNAEILPQVDGGGILATLVGRLVDAIGGSELFVERINGKTLPDDTVTTGLMNIVYIVNSLVTFFPNLGQNTLHGANAWFTKSRFAGTPALTDVYMVVENPSAGLKRAIMNEKPFDSTNANVKELTDRYFMKINKIECTNDANLQAANANLAASPLVVGGNGSYIASKSELLKPTEVFFFKVNGTPNGTGTKEFKITYEVVKKNGSPYVLDENGQNAYGGLTTYAYMSFDNEKTFLEELYNSTTGNFNSSYLGLTPGSSVSYLDGSAVATKATEKFGYMWSADGYYAIDPVVSIAYPASIAINNSASNELEKYRLAFRNYSDMDDGSGENVLDAVYPYAIGKDGTKKVMVSCDENGNLIDYSKPMEYYHPILGKVTDSNAWTTETTVKVGDKSYGYTQSRYHSDYPADAAKKLAGYEAFIDEGYILINYDKTVVSKVSCATPVKGTYVKATDIPLPLCNDEKYDNISASWLYPIPGYGVEVPDGVKSIDLAVGYTNNPESEAELGTAVTRKEVTFSIGVIAQNSYRRTALDAKLNQAKKYVDAHVANDFNGKAATLDAVRKEIINAVYLLNSPVTRKTSDSTFKNAIKNIDTALTNASNDVVIVDEKRQDLANVLGRDVDTKFNQYDAYDYYNLNYDITRNIKNLTWSVLSRTYDNPDIIVESSSDAEFNKLSSHRIYHVKADGKLEFVGEANYENFLVKLSNDSYDQFGLNAKSVEGKDYVFGTEEPRTDTSGNILYDHASTASVVEMKELKRLYDAYESTMVQRAYADNDTAILNEIKCATANDASNLAVNGGKIAVKSGTAAKYGKVENGVITNTNYTDESWANYEKAVTAAIQATIDAKAKVSELNRLRLNVMYAENNLEQAAADVPVKYTFTFANGTSVQVDGFEGKEPAFPANTASTFTAAGRPNDQNSWTHTETRYSWVAVEGTYEYKEVSTRLASEKCACTVDVDIQEATRGEAGYMKGGCVCGKRTYNVTTDPLGINVTVNNDRYNDGLGSATITSTDVKGKLTTVNANGVQNVKYTSEYTLVATEGANAKFVGWYSGNKLITTNKEYSTLAYADTVYEPVFEEIQDPNEFTITIMGYCNNILATVSSKDLQNFKFPVAPNDYVGVNFVGWPMTENEVKQLTQSTVIYANYEVAAAKTFTLTVQSGATYTVDGRNVRPTDKVAYNANVVVTKADATAWKINGQPAGFGSTLEFRCTGNTEVTYEVAAATVEPIVSIIDATEDPATHRVRFLATRSVPEGFELVESGFVYGKALTKDDLVLENVGVDLKDPAKSTVVLMKNANTAPDAQFGIVFGIANQSAPASARAYLIYKDADSKTHVIYSEPSIYEFGK